VQGNGEMMRKVLPFVVLVVAILVGCLQSLQSVQASPAMVATRTPIPTKTVTPVPPPPTVAKQGVWVYPGEPACDAAEDLRDYKFYSVNSEYLTVRAGLLVVLTEQEAGCNGYSPDNAAAVKAASTEQYVTISGAYDEFVDILHKDESRTQFVTAVTSFIGQIGFTGADLDFEGFAQWTPKDYTQYKKLLVELGTSLHTQGKKLQVDLPAIAGKPFQAQYQLKYEDLNGLPIDQYTIMAYDYHFDYGAGTPIQPIWWVENVIDWAQSKFDDDSKISIGVPLYGYYGKCGDWQGLTNTTYDYLAEAYDFATKMPQRDALSQELMGKRGNICFAVSDSVAIAAKVDAIQAKGIPHVSFWHLGGNNVFSDQPKQ